MNFPDLSEPVLRAIIECHGLPVSRISRLRSTGVVNTIYAFDDAYVLRVPKNEAEALSDTFTESVAAPAAWRAGVKTPQLLVFDESKSIVDVPYTIYERVHGETLGQLEDPDDMHQAWTGLGRDLAHLHATVTHCDDPLGRLDSPSHDDLRRDIDALGSLGVMMPAQARWLERWLDALAPAALAKFTPRFLHNDLQGDNVMVTAKDYEYLAMIDWGDAGWGEPALDLCWTPIRAIPFVVKGYREVQPFDGDDTVEARVLWDQIMNAIRQLRKSSQLGRVRTGYLMDLLRFVTEIKDPRFRCWLQGCSPPYTGRPK